MEANLLIQKVQLMEWKSSIYFKIDSNNSRLLLLIQIYFKSLKQSVVDYISFYISTRSDNKVFAIPKLNKLCDREELYAWKIISS